MLTWVYLLACAGLTWVFIASKLFERPRLCLASKSKFLASLLSCAFCTGFWSSLGLYYVLFNNEQVLKVQTLRLALLHALAGAMVAYAIDKCLLYINLEK
jgi:hypothetical protein